MAQAPDPAAANPASPSAGAAAGAAPAAPPGTGAAGVVPPATDWRAGLKPEFADVHQVKTAKDLNDIVQWGVNAEKLVGADKIVLPGKDAKPEEWGAVYDKLGRPATAEAYTIAEVKDRPYTDADKTLQGTFKPIAHKLGLTQAQVDGIVGFQNDLVAKGIEAATTMAANTEAALRKQHGDQYDAKLEAGNQALNAVLNAAKIDVAAFRQVRLADGSFLGDNPAMLGIFIAMGEVIGATPFEGGTPAGAAFNAFTTPAAAKAELDRLYATDFKDIKHPFNDRRSPQHKLWSDRVMTLQSVASKASS